MASLRAELAKVVTQRDAEGREADSLFQQLQAAQMVRQCMHAWFAARLAFLLALLSCSPCFPARLAFLHALLCCTSCFAARLAFLHILLSARVALLHALLCCCNGSWLMQGGGARGFAG